MRIRMTINCDNDAFQPIPQTELARIFRELADEFEFGMGDISQWHRINDINGNQVGVVEVLNQ